MSVSNAVKILMRYVSDNSIKLSDLFSSNNLQLFLPENVFSALRLLSSLCSSPILVQVNGRVLLSNDLLSHDWYYILRQVKKSVRFTSDKFQVVKYRGIYFINFKTTKERLIYVC